MYSFPTHYRAMTAENYQGYKGLPELVGLLPMTDALSKGLLVEESAARLKRFHWTARRLALVLTSRITAMPVYELKMALALHAHYLAEHVGPFFERVREMREPPYGLDQAPDPTLDVVLDEVQAAPTPEALVLGVYEVLVPALTRGLRRVLHDDNRLFDHPTYRVCRLALVELADVEDYGRQAVAALVTDEHRARYATWLTLLHDCLATLGDLDGSQPVQARAVERQFSATPYQHDYVPRRDERFHDMHNMGVNAESFLLDPAQPALPKTLMLYFKRLREIDVPEMMASIVYDTPGKPWGYYRDMIRQIWDESRHAMMGEVGFTSLGIDWRTIPFNITWSYLLNTKLSSQERHAVLFFIEQGLMPAKTGKQYEWEVAVATTNRLSRLVQDYDWADEILHARIGRDWIVPEVGGQPAAMAAGNAAWSKALLDVYEQVQADGLTTHANWWPQVYRQACAHWGIAPDPAVLAYHTTYQQTRADRKQVAV